MNKLLALFSSLVAFIAFSSNTFAQTQPQACADSKGNVIPLENDTVLGFKKTLPNLVKRQVFVKGTLVKYIGPIQNQHGVHLHFIVSLAGQASQPNNMAPLVEISHSMNGIKTPDYPTEADLRSGPIAICGEYSTTDINGLPKITQFTPSVTGAMIHWTHRADLQNGHLSHPHGWIFANGKIFGNDPARD